MERRHAYGRYQKARNAAWECLVDCRVRALPVQVVPIAAALGVKVTSYGCNADMLSRKGYAPLLDAAGFACADVKGNMIIFFNEQADFQQIRFTIAHELGHIVLNHVGLEGEEIPRGRLLLPSDPKLEKEADRFALRLLAPACALWAMNVYLPDDIAALCDIPPERAEARARRMQILRQRNKWLSDPQERRLFRQLGFSPPNGISLGGA